MTSGRRSTPRARALAAVGLALALVSASPAGADGQVPTLDVVDSLVTAGDYQAARDAMERWVSARDRFEVPGSDMARALLLRAQLAPDPAPAEADYLAVVLGYPASRHAPEALLRLGQGLLATGDASRAVAYLERLVADYPGRPERLTGLLWLARARTAARRPDAACRAARDGLRDTRDPDLAAMLRVEVAGCSSETDGRAETAAPRERVAAPRESVASTSSAARPPTVPVRPAATPEPGAPAGDWAVQVGAFRQRAGAEALMGRLREAGHAARVVRVPLNDLLRVRVGRFTTFNQATSLVERLRGQGFDALAVRDADLERQP